MKTLLVGDTHLMCGLILSFVSTVIKKRDVKRVILMGDYTDQWGCLSCPDIYKDDLRLLYDWKVAQEQQGIHVILLAGNHDVPYLINEKVYYSLANQQGFQWVKEILLSLKLQIAYQLDDYLVSHAGYTEDYEPEAWHFESLLAQHLYDLKVLHEQAGISRGGRFKTGSPIWADFNRDLAVNPNLNHLKQIVGHTPVRKIETAKQTIPIDTFSLDRAHFPIGDGSMLLYNEGNFQVIENPTWVYEEISAYFRKYIPLNG